MYIHLNGGHATNRPLCAARLKRRRPGRKVDPVKTSIGEQRRTEDSHSGRRAAQRRRRRRRSERPFLVVKAVALPFEARAPAGASPAFLYLLTDKARPEPFDPVRRLGFCAVGAW
ncbi:hypothetical protein MTO96_041791 [Rhipicephalus appendiculatus]